MDDLLNQAEEKCNDQYEAEGEACFPPDTETVDETACKKAGADVDACLEKLGITEAKVNVASDKEDEAEEGACKTEYDAFDKACPEDDQGEDDQGDSDPQM